MPDTLINVYISVVSLQIPITITRPSVYFNLPILY